MDSNRRASVSFAPTRRASISLASGQFKLAQLGSIADFYQFDQTKLQPDGVQIKAKHTSTGAERGLISISKEDAVELNRCRQEMKHLKAIDHPNIAKLIETFEDESYLFMIGELCVGGPLQGVIDRLGHLCEVKCASVMQQVFRVVCYLHDSCGICHRDLTTDTFVFLIGNLRCIEKNPIKLSGCRKALDFRRDPHMKERVSKPHYSAPEMVTGHYSKAVDMWSCGVIMYTLLMGCVPFPFQGREDLQVYESIKAGKFNTDSALWKGLSKEVKVLVKKLLAVDQDQRLDAKHAANAKWIRDTVPKANISTQQGSLLGGLTTFGDHGPLKQAALHVIAGQLDDSETRQLREIFNSMDDNGDGLLSPEEVKAGLQKTALKEMLPEIEQCLMELDTDGNGSVDYTEFLAATIDKQLYVQEDLCWAAFQVFDKNGDGSISVEEVEERLLQGKVDKTVTDQLYLELDANGDGEIDFFEFMEMMTRDVVAKDIVLHGGEHLREEDGEGSKARSGGPIRRRIMSMLPISRVRSALGYTAQASARMASIVFPRMGSRMLRS